MRVPVFAAALAAGIISDWATYATTSVGTGRGPAQRRLLLGHVRRHDGRCSSPRKFPWALPRGWSRPWLTVLSWNAAAGHCSSTRPAACSGLQEPTHDLTQRIGKAWRRRWWKRWPPMPDTRRGSLTSIPTGRLAAVPVPAGRRDRRVHHRLHVPPPVSPAEGGTCGKSKNQLPSPASGKRVGNEGSGRLNRMLIFEAAANTNRW